MDSEYASLLSRMIVEPFKRGIGKSLRSVVYYVLHTDYPDFDVEVVNASGCQGVHLTFDGTEVELDWDWQRAFLPSPEDTISPPLAYHLVARSLSLRQATVSLPTEEDVSGLGAINATEAMLWRQVHGEVLRAVTVWGVPLPEQRYSPQTAGFAFASGQVIVTVGMASPLSIGDGDEVLVFSDQEWKRILTSQANPRLTAFWQLPVGQR